MNATNTLNETTVLWEMWEPPANTTMDSPENSILVDRTIEQLRDELTSLTVNKTLLNAVQNYSDTHISMADVIQKYNVTVFSGYPIKLLCFGAICFVAFAVIGIMGNFISILALSRCRRLRNATTVFIVNLCVADFLFCSFSMPLSAVMFIQQTWYLGEVLCKLFPVVRYSNGAVSIFSVIAITVNRYVLIVHPHAYQGIYRKRNLVIMVTLIWFMSLFLLLFPLFEVWGTLGYDPKVGTCTILKLNGKSPKIFFYIAAFVLPSIIFVGCYSRIFFAVRKASKRVSRREVESRPGTITFSVRSGIIERNKKHSQMVQRYPHNHRDKRELRVLRLMLVIFLLFIVCYFPVSFVKIFRKEDDLPILNVLGYLSVYFSNIINPIIYIVMSKEYRTAYKELFCQAKMKRQTMINQLNY